MTVSSTTARVDYVGSGTVGPFSYSFRIMAATDLEVTTATTAGLETTLSYPGDFSVSGVGNSGGGSVTLVTALATGYALTIRRVLPLLQSTSIRNQGAYFPATIEDMNDRNVMMAQQLSEVDSRMMTLAVTVDPTVVSPQLPVPVANKGLRWNAAGTALETFTFDASAIGVPGAGRTVTTATDYLNNNATINVRDFADTFGVVGATQFQNAVNAGALYGLPVVIPDGGVTLSAAVTLPSNSRLIGSGPNSTITFTNAAGYGFFASGKTNITIDGLRLTTTVGAIAMWLSLCTELDVRNCTMDGWKAPISLGTYCGGLFVLNSDDATIENNHFYNNGYSPGLSSDIQINGAAIDAGNNRIRIVGNRCLSTAVQTNIIAYDVNDSEINGNVCNGATTPPPFDSGGYGIALYRIVYAPDTSLLEDNRIINNSVSNCEGTGIYLQHGRRMVCTGNTVHTTGSVETDAVLGVGGICISDCLDSVCTGNTVNDSSKCGIIITGSLQRDGITIGDNQINGAGDIGISLRCALTRSTVVANVITDTVIGIGTSGSPLAILDCLINDNVITATRSNSAGIKLYGAGRTMVQDNNIRGSGGAGIEIVDAVGFNTISGNSVVNGGTAANNTYTALNLASPHITVVGNKLSNTGATGYANGLVMTSACTNSVEALNDISGMLTAAKSVNSVVGLAQFGTGIQFTGAPSSIVQLLLGSSSNISSLSTAWSSGALVVANNARQVGGADLWTQPSAGLASTCLRISTTEFEVFKAAAGTVNGTFAAFWGTSVFDSNLATGNIAINGSRVLAPRVTGWTTFTGASTKAAAAFDTTTVTTAQLASVVKAMLDSTITMGFNGA